MEPSTSCGDASQKRKRKTLYNHQEVLALLTNLDTDSESKYEDSGSEFELGKYRSNGQHDSDSVTTVIDLDLDPDLSLGLDQKVISHLQRRKRRPYKKREKYSSKPRERTTKWKGQS